MGQQLGQDAAHGPAGEQALTFCTVGQDPQRAHGSHGLGSEVTVDRPWDPACLGDESTACLLWTSGPGVREGDPRLRPTSWERGAVRDPSPAPVPTSSPLTCPALICPRPDHGPHCSPHVDAGGLRGSAQQQFGGSVPADGSTPPRVQPGPHRARGTCTSLGA